MFSFLFQRNEWRDNSNPGNIIIIIIIILYNFILFWWRNIPREERDRNKLETLVCFGIYNVRKLMKMSRKCRATILCGNFFLKNNKEFKKDQDLELLFTSKQKLFEFNGFMKTWTGTGKTFEFLLKVLFNFIATNLKLDAMIDALNLNPNIILN